MSASSEEKKWKNRESSRKYDQKERQTWAGNSVAGVMHPLRPVILWTLGNATKRQIAHDWIGAVEAKLLEEEIQQKQEQRVGGALLRRKRAQEEFYAEQKAGMPPTHMYRNVQFVDHRILPTGCKSIKPLTDAVFGKSVEETRNYNFAKPEENDDEENDAEAPHEFFKATIDEAMEAIKKRPDFQGAAIKAIWDNQQSTMWESALCDSTDVDEDTVTNLLKGDKGLKDPFKYMFRAASLHIQTPGTQEKSSAYYPHKDKVGNIVCFVGLRGYSYNFIATHAAQSSSQEKAKLSMAVKAKLSEAGSSYKSYQSYKSYLEGKKDKSEFKAVCRFEEDFLCEAKKLGLMHVRVYELKPACTLAFPAKSYYHGTIIPGQLQTRVLLVMHDLVPYESRCTY
jgi:hypothetical protein